MDDRGKGQGCLRKGVIWVTAGLGLWYLGGCQGQVNVPKPTVRQVVNDHPRTARSEWGWVGTSSKGNSESGGEWIPPRSLEVRGRWEGIIIHHSASDNGCAAKIDKQHKSQGWDGLGYDFVINNGRVDNGWGKTDGLVEVGYRWRKQLTGSHCRPEGNADNYWNEHTIGICLVGNFEKYPPTEKQMRALVELVRFLQDRYNIPTRAIKGHGDVKPTKCPGRYFSFWELRRRLGN